MRPRGGNEKKEEDVSHKAHKGTKVEKRSEEDVSRKVRIEFNSMKLAS